jgi:hypothetical protein
MIDAGFRFFWRTRPLNAEWMVGVLFWTSPCLRTIPILKP